MILEVARRQRLFVTFRHGDRWLGRCKIGCASEAEVREARQHFAETHGLAVDQVSVSYGEREE
jgi:hypothetical protein